MDKYCSALASCLELGGHSLLGWKDLSSIRGCLPIKAVPGMHMLSNYNQRKYLQPCSNSFKSKCLLWQIMLTQVQKMKYVCLEIWLEQAVYLLSVNELHHNIFRDDCISRIWPRRITVSSSKLLQSLQMMTNKKTLWSSLIKECSGEFIYLYITNY